MRFKRPVLILAPAAISLWLMACASAPSPPVAEPTALPSEPADSGPAPTATPVTDEAFTERRMKMVEETIAARGVSDPAVLTAMQAVLRHRFVPPEYVNQAYADHPLPIGYGQTISQPYVVALMTEALDLEADDVVLEIGTGSGYQAAVLAEIVAQVYTIEIIEYLVDRTEPLLHDLGYINITVRNADGYFGWEEHAPFDAIIVTAAPDHVPPPLRAQLADGGRLVIPVGPPGGYQELWLIERHGEEFTSTSLGGVAFVPLTREGQGQDE